VDIYEPFFVCRYFCYNRNMRDKIHFILTGGTIDSTTKGRERDVLLEHSAVPEYLRNLNLHPGLKFSELFMKDSREITDIDREKILQIIQRSHETKVIVTHGTYTMAETARFLKRHISRKDQVIILTGAMIPLKFENSDAPFNLKYALEQVGTLSPGIYVCMDGRTSTPEDTVISH
jgi:L-asparaginase